MPEIHFNINDALYLKDPQESKFGKKILIHSIVLFNDIGFEAFTFKKLAVKMDSAEASIYRYFENKHKVLLYLSNWYWEWLAYCIHMNTMNVKDPYEKLDIVVNNIVSASDGNLENGFIDQKLLQRVIIQESTKSYHINDVDEENKLGFFLSYKRLAEFISGIITEINPEFAYPKSLSSNLLEMANNQIYFAEHLPRLTDIQNTSTKDKQLITMLKMFALKLLK